MRQSLGQLLRHATVGVLTLAAVWAPCGSPAAAPAASAAPAPEATDLAFDQRYRALQHGGIVRAANTSVTCRAQASSCRGAQTGGHGVNGDFDMFYVDVDSDPNTYNSSRAEVRLPAGSRVTYARLYWGGNLLAGEQKPWQDNGRVLIAEPGGEYKELLADTVVGHRVADGADAFQASADVTALVRDSGPGLYTVAQVNVAMGRSAAGSWGGWTLVVAYENPAEPLRHLALWDGFAPLMARGETRVPLRDLPFPAGAGGRVGLVAYNGDRGTPGDSLVLTTGGPASVSTALADRANPGDDVLNSTVSDPGTAPARVPAYANTLGYDSDVFDLAGALPHSGDEATFRLASQRDAAWAGVLFAAVDARR
ncbi:DUF3344 domain-containing protein [Streptomyces griseomycini]|uniref:DUF3344 domain-containing protein n=1 Tax=Streptomyces griseomycini TaxID=66895 RepID=A0A7W7V858_9ACTN|nr:DUF3344 domain-containing protein [Streptomyces griseomycini]MBB4900927.1 hypothetical protein [Streptomyces griseomycini]GGR15591.1 hypothetical protein GCM10015536_21440 [Streptomyces griseomycini]